MSELLLLNASSHMANKHADRVAMNTSCLPTCPGYYYTPPPAHSNTYGRECLRCDDVDEAMRWCGRMDCLPMVFTYVFAIWAYIIDLGHTADVMVKCPNLFLVAIDPFYFKGFFSFSFPSLNLECCGFSYISREVLFFSTAQESACTQQCVYVSTRTMLWPWDWSQV